MQVIKFEFYFLFFVNSITKNLYKQYIYLEHFVQYFYHFSFELKINENSSSNYVLYTVRKTVLIFLKQLYLFK